MWSVERVFVRRPAKLSLAQTSKPSLEVEAHIGYFTTKNFTNIQNTSRNNVRHLADKHQPSLTNPRDALHHGERAASK